MDIQTASRCACGHGILTASTYAKGRYLAHDRFLLSLGATRRPIRVEVRCSVCDHVFGVSTDQALRERTCARDWISRDDLQKLQMQTAL